MSDNGDVQIQLNDLAAEEARIMRELRDLDEKAEKSASRHDPHPHHHHHTLPTSHHTHSPRHSSAAIALDDHPSPPAPAPLHVLLSDCEKEVRDAKGYIADEGPPLHIVRLRHGETGPKSATYLSRPRGTGVDFTVPVGLKGYTDVIKHPIFLNDIRDKIRSRRYQSVDHYLADMRLLHSNTSAYNKGPELLWVVQHAKLLVDAAEDAVRSRQALFNALPPVASSALPHRPSSTHPKRKRNSLNTSNNNNPSTTTAPTPANPPNAILDIPSSNSLPNVGAHIDIWKNSPSRRWHSAVVVDRSPTEVYLRFLSDDSQKWVNLNAPSVKWRQALPSRPASKKRRASASASASAAVANAGVVIVPESPVASSIGGGHPTTVTAAGAGEASVVGVDETMRSLLRSHSEAITVSVRTLLDEQTDRIQSSVHQSGGLKRVLMAVQDLREWVDTSFGDLARGLQAVESRMAVLERAVGSVGAANGSAEPQEPVQRIEEGKDVDKDEGKETDKEGNEGVGVQVVKEVGNSVSEDVDKGKGSYDADAGDVEMRDVDEVEDKEEEKEAKVAEKTVVKMGKVTDEETDKMEEGETSDATEKAHADEGAVKEGGSRREERVDKHEGEDKDTEEKGKWPEDEDVGGGEGNAKSEKADGMEAGVVGEAAEAEAEGEAEAEAEGEAEAEAEAEGKVEVGKEKGNVAEEDKRTDGVDGAGETKEVKERATEKKAEEKGEKKEEDRRKEGVEKAIGEEQEKEKA